MGRLSTNTTVPRRSTPLRETIEDYLERLPVSLERSFSDVVRVVNENEGGPILADALPDPSEQMRGRLVATRGTGASGEDELHFCRWDGVSAFEWVEVTVV